MIKIILSGGGTGGSVSPLLAVAEEIKRQNPETLFLFIGTKRGEPEKEMAKINHLPYQGILSGKFRRYFSFKNIIDPILVILGFIQSLFIILKFRPWAIFSAGGFVAVPVCYAAWFLNVPIFIHQQDLTPGLANKIISPLAKKITVSFEKSLNDYPKEKTILTGNPFRAVILKGDNERAIKRFNLRADLPVLLVVGGGSGAKKINQMIIEIISELVKFCQIIHITGKDKGEELKPDLEDEILVLNRYHQIDFLTRELPDVFQIANLVITRAGLGVLTEISVLGKPSIIIPIPDSHQEVNARYFQEKEAAVIFQEKDFEPDVFLKIIKDLINSKEKLSLLGKNILKISRPQAGEEIAKIILRR